MGGFATRSVSVPEAVVVKPPVSSSSSSSSRHEPVQRSLQAKGSSDISGNSSHRDAQQVEVLRSALSSTKARVGEREAQLQQALRQKKPGSSSFHVNSRINSDTLAAKWDEALEPDVALAEEEEMQLAIEASLQEKRGCSSWGHGRVDCRCKVEKQMMRSSVEDESGEVGQSSTTGKIQAHARERMSGAYPTSKATALGFGKDYAWVDNSDFQGTGKSKASDRKAMRSASAVSRSHSIGATGSSNIVSLPRISKQVPTEQQLMVKELHEKIRETISSREEPRGTNTTTGKRAVADTMGKRAAADVRTVMEEPEVRTVMEDLCIDEPLRRPRGGSSERELLSEQFNERFHSLARNGGNTSMGGNCYDRVKRYESPFSRERGPTM